MRKFLSWLRGSGGAAPVAPPALPALMPGDLDDLLISGADLPMIDWDAVDSRAERIEGGDHARDLWRRAIAAAWLDRLANELETPHVRWRTANVEGLAPRDEDLGRSIPRVAEAAFVRIHEALGDTWDGHPIAPVAVVAMSTQTDYYTLKASSFDLEGEFAASGGCYLDRPFPIVLLPTVARWAVDSTIAHELTHHALKVLSLPLWAEEGLTQMMEERVTRHTSFRVDRKTVDRHIAHWSTRGMHAFWSGEAFSSAEEDDQELAYHLAEILARRMLADRPREYLAFLKQCDREDHGADAAHRRLGMTLGQLAAGSLGPGNWEPQTNDDHR
ncbi:MAG: hypothetical protein KF869_07415 [Phycisphaeraceae bacterium]|nr:hypothetical protein [Phycisphaeraceae bacterium]